MCVCAVRTRCSAALWFFSSFCASFFSSKAWWHECLDWTFLVCNVCVCAARTDFCAALWSCSTFCFLFWFEREMVSQLLVAALWDCASFGTETDPQEKASTNYSQFHKFFAFDEAGLDSLGTKSNSKESSHFVKLCMLPLALFIHSFL